MKKLQILSFVALFGIFFTACSDDDTSTPDTANLTLNFTGLEDLGSDYAYEGWLIVDGNPVSTGVFNVGTDGNASETSFSVASADLDAATTFVLTIEPSPDNDPAPSDVHILAGDFSGNNADLTVGHGAALGDDFTNSAGTYILATPTNGNDNEERSGVWFLDPAAGPGAGLDLPTLPAGWVYEGWAVINGTPVTTGRFTDVAAADDDATFSGDLAGPPFPGEDFLNNAPGDLAFPTDLAGATVVISVEPSPDNSPSPFLLKPLVHGVPADAADHVPFGMNNNAANTNPTGTVNR